MYSLFANLTYVESDNTKITIADNTDFSIDGSSKRIAFVDAEDEYVTVGFTEVDLTNYEELCFYGYTTPVLGTTPVIKVTIDGVDYELKQLNERRSSVNQKFFFLQFDCSEITTISSFRITCLRSDLILFFDMPLYRKAGLDTIDTDILTALQAHISLDYDQDTTISEAGVLGEKYITLADDSYINDTSKIIIDDGVNSQTVNIVGIDNLDIELEDALAYNFANATPVSVLCPVKAGKVSDVVNDPVCGIIISDKQLAKEDEYVKMESGQSKLKRFLGALEVLIYVEASSEKKALYLARQFEQAYGDAFQFLLDGELVEVYQIDSDYIGKEIGGLARSSYLYEIYPQGITLAIGKAITTHTLTVGSADYEEL